MKIIVDAYMLSCGTIELIGRDCGIYQERGEEYREYLDRIVNILKEKPQ